MYEEESTMNNTPEVKIGIVAVSRDCFPESLSVNRRKALVEAYKAKYDASEIYECPVCIVESEKRHGEHRRQSGKIDGLQTESMLPHERPLRCVRKNSQRASTVA